MNAASKINGNAIIQTASRTHMICKTCGSTDVRADAHSAWDADAGKWVLLATYDAKYCENCDSSTSLLEIDEQSQLEIQAFGMVTSSAGARLANDNEQPQFFDVLLSTIPSQSGVILSLEDHSDMSVSEAARTVAALVEEYPTAALNINNCDFSVVSKT